MEIAWAPAVILLLSPLTLCSAATDIYQQQENNTVPPSGDSDCLCRDNICSVSPDKFWCLQKQIHSSHTIILIGENFNAAHGSIVIENVSNLTISGGESGSIIQCSPNYSFGFHLKNVTNVTLTGIRIRNCSSAIPHHLLNTLNSFNETTLLIEASKTVTLSNIHIEQSPGVALAVFEFSNSSHRRLFTNTTNPHVRVTDCTFSHNSGSMFIYGTSSLYIGRTNITNTSTGIVSYNANMMIENVDIINCTTTTLIRGQVLVKNRLTMNQSTLYCSRQYFYARESNIHFFGGKSQRGLFVDNSNLIIENSTILFRKFYLDTDFSFALYLTRSSFLQLRESIMTFKENIVNGGTTILSTANSPIDMIKNSSLVIENNVIEAVQYAGLWIASHWTMDPESLLLVRQNTAKKGFFIKFMSRTVNRYWNISLSGSVRIENNTIGDFGVFNIFSSNVIFAGHLEALGNRVESGVINADASDIHITNRASFSDNYAANGGAVTLSFSAMKVLSSATVEFTRNKAEGLGGAIYISKPYAREIFCEPSGIRYNKCSIQIFPVNDSAANCQSPFSVSENRAGIAGNVIYGGLLSACMHCVVTNAHFNCPNTTTSDVDKIFQYENSSELSSFTSDPTRVCFCEHGIPDCYKAVSNITVHPGEQFILSLAIVGYGLGTVPGSVIARNSNRGGTTDQNLFDSDLELSQEIRGTSCQDIGYSILSEKNREQISLAASTLSFVQSIEEVQAVVEFQLTKNRMKVDPRLLLYLYDMIYDSFFHIPVFVEVDLLPCPVGFQLVRGKCVCHQILLDNNINNCFFSNGTGIILRPAPYWIGLPNDTNSSILIHPNCPYDYCQSEDMNITAESPNTLCQYQRSGVLCGSCREGLSMILGSSECKTCSNVYLTSITVFILMGVALVMVLALLNMTVSVGTLNGLILFANILQANKTLFLPQTSDTSPLIGFLSAFIAWLNLDIGIPMCFFNGLTTYVKTWLQFVFPLYILTLVGVIIIATKYSTRVTRLFGTNAVSVLATLVLLSYTKILRILITAFSFTILTGSQGYHSVVWLADGNIQYFELKHAILFLVALLVLLLLEVPYTVTLTAAPWIQRSRFKRVSSLYNRFKPLFDAYMGPYKDSHRYWTGMLLLARVVLIVLFSSIANTNTAAGPQLNLLLLTLSSSALLALTAALRPYKNKLLNALETFYLSILLIFSSSNLYITSIGTGIGPRAYIYIVLVGVCFFVFLGICVGHVWYRVRKARTGRRPEPPPEREEEDWYPLWQRARIRAEDEDEERATLSTVGAPDTNEGRRGSIVELIADDNY